MSDIQDILDQSNDRSLNGWRRFLEVFFSHWQWVRKLIGGKWERYYVEVCADFIWHPVTAFERECGLRPSPLCRCTPDEEEW